MSGEQHGENGLGDPPAMRRWRPRRPDTPAVGAFGPGGPPGFDGAPLSCGGPDLSEAEVQKRRDSERERADRERAEKDAEPDERRAADLLHGSSNSWVVNTSTTGVIE
ncbi:hypothetical protein [Actinoplanes sp. NPDC051859]|uniref:hypothetical protein n=1 Tax=Actinoplanes sp. NPDC051859 TaxID=3363909 RepID=UPI00378EA9A8